MAQLHSLGASTVLGAVLVTGVVGAVAALGGGSTWIDQLRRGLTVFIGLQVATGVALYVSVSLLAAGAVGALLPGAMATGSQSASLRAGWRSSLASDGDVNAGHAVFNARCATCHGDTGQGTALGPSLVGAGAAAADFELRTGRMPFNGSPGTQAVRKPPAFDDATIRNLVAYVAALGTGP